MKQQPVIKLSPCCKAEIDYRGGGYEDEYIHPVEGYCTKCNRTVDINGTPIKFCKSGGYYE